MTETWDGRPENPERDGWHWAQHRDNTPEVLNWSPLHGWRYEGDWVRSDFIGRNYRYFGPASPPPRSPRAMQRPGARGSRRRRVRWIAVAKCAMRCCRGSKARAKSMQAICANTAMCAARCKLPKSGR